MNNIRLSIAYPPTPWARPAGRSMRYDAQVKEKAAFTKLVIEQLNGNYPERKWDIFSGPLFPSGVPVMVGLCFTFKDERKTKSLYYPKPDIDNLSKFVLDSLQSSFMEGILWDDDKQVTSIGASKRYGIQDQITISIEKDHYERTT